MPIGVFLLTRVCLTRPAQRWVCDWPIVSTDLGYHAAALSIPRVSIKLTTSCKPVKVRKLVMT